MTLSSTVCALVASRKVPPHPTPTQPNPTQQKCSAVIRALVCVRPKMMKKNGIIGRSGRRMGDTME